MITELIRILVLLGLSASTGVLGIIWLFGSNPSIYITVAVKPFAIILLVISYVLYDQLKREIRKIDNRK